MFCFLLTRDCAPLEKPIATYLNKEVVEVGGGLARQSQQVLHAVLQLPQLELAHALLNDDIRVGLAIFGWGCLAQSLQARLVLLALHQQLREHVDVRGVIAARVLDQVALQKLDCPAACELCSQQIDTTDTCALTRFHQISKRAVSSLEK